MRANNEPEKNQRRVEFEQRLAARVMSIDGTWCGDGFLIDISDTEAQIEATGQAAELAEFFLVLTSFGSPVFRRCTRRWVRGARMGVSFNKTQIGIKSLEDEVRPADEKSLAA
jgi:hypothetical protein